MRKLRPWRRGVSTSRSGSRTRSRVRLSMTSRKVRNCTPKISAASFSRQPSSGWWFALNSSRFAVVRRGAKCCTALMCPAVLAKRLLTLGPSKSNPTEESCSQTLTTLCGPSMIRWARSCPSLSSTVNCSWSRGACWLRRHRANRSSRNASRIMRREPCPRWPRHNRRSAMLKSSCCPTKTVLSCSTWRTRSKSRYWRTFSIRRRWC